MSENTVANSGRTPPRQAGERPTYEEQPAVAEPVAPQTNTEEE